jgi:hypothetical protein
LEGWCPDFARAAYRPWLLGKQDPGQPALLREWLAGLGREAARGLQAGRA